MAPVDCIQNTESSAMSTTMLPKSLPLLPSPPSTCAVPTNNFTIKTSKKWVLPPRPKPGRKPVDSDHHESITEDKKTNSVSNSVVPPQIPPQKPSPAPSQQQQQQQQQQKQKMHTPQQPIEKPKSKRGRKSHSEKAKQTELSNNPIKQAIMKVNEENYYLKLEVIKLVSDLKSLKYETEQLNQDPVAELTGGFPLGQEQQQNQDISSVPMGYNSTSNRTNNNNTIYKINSNVSTNLSTPIMATTTSSSPLTSATTPPPTTTITHGKKRPHDDDINHLILSLIDLNHSNEVSPLTSSNLDSLHSEQIIEATVKKLNDKKKQQQQVQKQQQNFNCTNFLNLDHIEEDEVISASPNHDFIHDDNDSIDVESLTPNSLLSLTKTNSTIDEIDLDNHNHFSPQLIDIPEVPLPSSESFANAQQGDELHAVTDNYEFSFWKNNNDDDKLKKNFVFNTNSTLDELIMERQREREEELLNYNEFNDLIDFDNTNKNNTLTKDEDNVSHIIFNDDWRLDDDDLLNF